jgi:hypothetical protein
MRPAAIDHVSVVVPAHNEAELLGRQLAAIERAVGDARFTQPQLSVSTTVVLDSCRDDSAQVVAHFPDVDLITVELGCVGLARLAGVEAARPRHPSPASHTWVACTDADSEVPAQWLLGQLGLAAAGAQLVLGTVWPDPEELESGPLRHWWSRHVLHDGHPYVHGANLGFTLEAYDAVGGFRDRTTGEDVDLVDRMKAAGISWTATSRLPVLTSGRLAGRAPDGFASYLTSLTP